ncbi:MAG: hypothetical protein PHH49_04810 [Candidatus Omnitrophica bacterium]|nr:hypothetical protein [Candidatus Omnitrophota bacterium]
MLFLVLPCPFQAPVARAQDTFETSSNDIKLQIKFYSEVKDYLNDLFNKFGDGYLSPDAALTKVTFIKLEYIKIAEPVPNEAKELFERVKTLLNRAENYFIYYKSRGREDPEINYKLAQAQVNVVIEADRLSYRYAR